MRKFKDDRNRSYCDVFPAIGVGDINISVMYPGTIKAFHRHQKQDDYWFIVKGNIRAVVATELPPTTSKQYVTDWIPEYISRSDGISYATAEFLKYEEDPRFMGLMIESKTEQKTIADMGTAFKVPKFYLETTQYGRFYTEKVENHPPQVSEHYLSEGDILHIPAGAWHGLQVLGNEDAIMIYHITNKYDPKNPDEERAPWDKFHNWEFSRK